MKSQNLRISMIASALMIFLVGLGVLVSGPRTRAQSTAVSENEGEDRDQACSNRTIRGDYGFAIEGDILAGPNRIPLRSVAMTHFDGEGNLSQVEHFVFNGVPPAIEWSPSSGTYKVNPDCTGTAQILLTGFPPVNLHLVVVRHGREIHTVVDVNAVTSIGIKRD